MLLVLACAPTRGEREEPPARPRADGAAAPETPEAPETPKAPETPEAPPPTAADESRWICKSDEDCVQTCGLGAVSKSWLEDNPNADDCDDGCSWNHEGVRCREGGCVTIDANGDVDASCTRRPQSIFD